MSGKSRDKKYKKIVEKAIDCHMQSQIQRFLLFYERDTSITHGRTHNSRYLIKQLQDR